MIMNQYIYQSSSLFKGWSFLLFLLIVCTSFQLEAKQNENTNTPNNLSIAREWNELLLTSIRNDYARPTVHARNLFHISVAMYDAWAAFDETACTYFLGKTVDGYVCEYIGIPAQADVQAAREAAISYAAYRILSHRFASSPQAIGLQAAYNNKMISLGYSTAFTSIDYTSGSAAALGNYIAQCLIGFGEEDLSNEQNDYGNTSYSPVNQPLILANSGNSSLSNFNRWQPLAFSVFIDQSGNQIPTNIPPFLSPEWGRVSEFCLQPNDLTINQRNGFDYWVYHDPGTPPNLMMDGSGQSDEYQWGFSMVAVWSSHLDPTDGVMWDISPGALGNTPNLPTTLADYHNFYDYENGGSANVGHSINPITGQAYAPNMVPRGDFARVLAEFWADGPDSETPPGHWFTLLNYVSDHPQLQKRFKGEGAILDDLEWDVKAYFTLGGAMHDAAITAWGIKGWYDYLRPISAIRGMAELGQSSDPNAASYHPAGLPLVPNYIELVEVGDPLGGTVNQNVGKIKIKAWKGHDYINNTETDEAGVDWILAEDWVTYQRPTFVTPPFAGYVSGHSTFSRAAAEVLTLFTGDAYFPGGMGTFLAEQDQFLVFEDGPSVDVELQWATYRDAADQSALSRIWGGIHPPADDVPGRIMGAQIGIDAFNFASSYFTYDCEAGVALDAKVFLQGPYNNGLMNTALSSLGFLVDTEPYSDLGFTHVGEGGRETTDAAVLAQTANDAVVDWLFVELRSELDNTIVIATRSALLLADGRIVDVDGSSPLYFRGVSERNYYVVVKHKSHVSIMSPLPVALTRTPGPLLDFTSGSAYGNNPQKDLTGGFYGMFEGDLNASGLINAEDRSIAWNVRNQTGYIQEDSNLDGAVDASERSTTWNNRNIVSQVP